MRWRCGTQVGDTRRGDGRETNKIKKKKGGKKLGASGHPAAPIAMVTCRLGREGELTQPI